MRRANRWVYEGRRTAEISFPLGGIGSGCIGLAGNGRLIDWEIFNRPNKGGLNGFSHFAIKAERGGQVLDARVVQGDLPPPYSGSGSRGNAGFGFGPERATMAGLPHFRKVSFEGEFPLATLHFTDARFPGNVRLTAFNPFIPMNEADSSLPAAFFEFEIAGNSGASIDYTIAFTARNPHKEKSTNRVVRSAPLTLAVMDRDGLQGDDPAHGGLCAGTDADDVSLQTYWFRGAWFDNLGVWWRDFTAAGALRERVYPAASGGSEEHATLAARLSLPPGEARRVRFILAWHYPNMTNYWNPEKPPAGCTACGTRPATWRNGYATRFADAEAVARYSLVEWDRLYRATVQFKETLFGSTVPEVVREAVSANISILKTPTVMRLEDGSLYGFEGCRSGAGCCEGSCQHVWNYAYALPFLFPGLERSMRELEYRHSLAEDGGLAFRLQLPIGRSRSRFRPCADGQFGTVMKVYREWKISGDTEWLRRWWPKVRQSIEFAWAPTNADRWDPERTGVLWGRQHHTLDMELFGPNAWLTGFYLGALKAGAEMAAACGAPQAATEYQALFAKGKAWVDRHLFNGEYYHQQVDLNSRTVLEPYSTRTPEGGFAPDEAYVRYWDEEHGELKYQVLEGCGIDQVVAQWHANLMGLGELFDRRQTRRALRSIYRYNFRKAAREEANFCRLYCLNDEAGTRMFEWPAGTHKPVVPVPYAEETMHGFEYQAACHLIQEGMVREGVAMVAAVRDRYDGEKRNPWNEIECGSNYARSMSSYALLHAFSGFSYDLTKGEIGFRPVRIPKEGFRCFWALGTAWGDVAIGTGEATLRVQQGRLALRVLDLALRRGQKVRAVCLAGRPLTFAFSGGRVRLTPAEEISAGEALTVELA